MSSKAYDQFSFELRQFRLANEMSRAALASVLGISPSTLKQWEDGKAQARTYKLWEVYDRVKVFADQDKSGESQLVLLLGVFDELISNLELANFDHGEREQREIDKKLSKTILRAAQTDFALSSDRRSIVPVPFTEDLSLWRNNRLTDIRQLLSSIVANLEHTIPHIAKANLNSERLFEVFQFYIAEAKLDAPNPRLLHRKGELLRKQIQNPETRSALSEWDTDALDGFVSDHQELMKLYFGEALHASQEVERARIDDRILPEASRLIAEAISAFDGYEETRTPEELSFDARVPAILVEISKEVEDYQVALQSSNSPSARRSATDKIKTSIKHVGIFIARLMLRGKNLARSAAINVGAFTAWLEVVAPGSFRAIYEIIRLSFPALPPLF